MANNQITPFQLTDQFTMDNFNQRINETNTALQKKANPWINDNGFFGNPVNQRGQAVYTNTDNYAPMYGIDRWFTTGNGNKPTVTIKDGYIEWTAPGMYNVFAQKKEAKSYAGKTITLSAIAKSTQNAGLHIVFFDSKGTNLSDSLTTLYSSSDFQLVQRTIDVPDDCTVMQYGFLSLAEGETTVAATAYKVEIGSQQTLAHQENGVWVLNEIPNYGEQLARCQRYFYAFNFEDWPGVGTYWGRGTSSTEIEVYNLIFPVTMRVNPSVKMLRVYDVVTGETFDVVANGYNNKKEGFHAIGVSSGMTVTVDRTYVISKAQFSADL